METRSNFTSGAGPGEPALIETSVSVALSTVGSSSTSKSVPLDPSLVHPAGKGTSAVVAASSTPSRFHWASTPEDSSGDSKTSTPSTAEDHTSGCEHVQ
jgi:hypothetical protein